MRFITILFFPMMTVLALHSQAADYYLGADVVPLNSWSESKNFICGSDCKGHSDGHSNGTVFRIGVWLPGEGINQTGWELGYDKLGSLSGNTTYSLQGCSLFCSGPNVTATWRHEATIVHIDMLGKLPLSHSSNGGQAVFGKIGIYRSTVKTEGNYGLGGGPYSRVVTGSGLLLGAGYIHPITAHLSARVASDLFLFANVSDPIIPGGTLSDIFVKVSLGMDYTF